MLRVYKLHLGSPEFTRFSGLMDTYMDTTDSSGFLSVSQVTDEVLYTGLVEMQELEELEE